MANMSWVSATPQNPCPICGKKNWCSVSTDNAFVNCRGKAEGALKEKIDSSGDVYFVHKGPAFVEGKTVVTQPYSPRSPLTASAVIELRDKVYQQLLKSCPLHDDHFERLTSERGLLKETIAKNCFGSARNINRATERLYQNFGDQLFQVPGFIKMNFGDVLTRVKTLSLSGILIPSKNLNGNIVSLRLRLDDVEEGGSKYLWFSLQGGAKLDPNIDVNYGVNFDKKTLIVTEGEFKAVRWVQQFKEHAALGMPGIGSCRRSLALIEVLKPERVVLAPDRDVEVKHQVFRPVGRLFGELKNLGYNVQLLIWNDHQHKGIDDALNAGCEFEYLNTQAAEEYLQSIAKNLDFPDDHISKGFSGCTEIEKFDDEWDEEPSDIDFQTKPLPQIEASDFPEALRDYINDSKDRLSIPTEYAAFPLFAVLTSLIGRKLAIRPKRLDTWTVVPVIWPLLIGRPSMRKTPAVNTGLTLLEKLTEEVLEQNEKNITDWLAESKILIQEREALLKKLSGVKQKKDDSEDNESEQLNRDEIKQEIAEIEYKLRNCKPPEIVYFLSDSTKEALVDVLKENPNGILIVRDEFSAFLKGLGVKGREQDRGLYLELYNGKNPYVERRRSREALSLKATVASMLGGIQPGPLAEYLIEANKGGSGADGFMPRFTLIWPDKPPFAYVDRLPDSKAYDRVWNIVLNLSKFSAKDFGIDCVDKSGLPYIGFAEDVQGLFVSWLISNEEKAAKETKSEAIEAFLGKLPNTVCTLSLLFHLCNQLDSGCKKIEPISHQALTLAIRWCEIIEAHARKTYLGCTTPDIARALILLEKIESGDLTNGMTVREIYRKSWTNIKKREDVLTAMTHLEKANCARIMAIKSNANGALSEVVLIHPLLRRNSSSKES